LASSGSATSVTATVAARSGGDPLPNPFALASATGRKRLIPVPIVQCAISRPQHRSASRISCLDARFGAMIDFLIGRRSSENSIVHEKTLASRMLQVFWMLW